MTLSAASIWYDLDTAQPAVGERVLVLVLRRHVHKDWAWEGPRFDSLDVTCRWALGTNAPLTTLWARLHLPELPEVEERQAAIEAARRYADLRARQTALDQEFSEEFRRQMVARIEPAKESV